MTLASNEVILENDSTLELFILNNNWTNCSFEHKQKWLRFAFAGEVTIRKIIFGEDDKAIFHVRKVYTEDFGFAVVATMEIEIPGLRARFLGLTE